MKRRYDVQVVVALTIEIDDEVLDEAMTKEWQGVIFPVRRWEHVVEYIAHNMVRGAELTIIDGFAHMKNEQARLSSVDWFDWEIKEIAAPKPKPPAPKKRKRAA